MTEAQLHNGRSRTATTCVIRVVLTILAAGGTCLATGFSGPGDYLSQSEQRIEASPEFFWEWEVKRLATDFHPPEKLHLTDMANAQNSEEKTALLLQATCDADLEDFAAALQEGRIKPGDPAKASAQHAAARDPDTATDDPPTEEFASEFADYHRGAFVYRLGSEHWEQARKAWQALLDRPAGERHYRSVWAAFMLGKTAMKSGDYMAAVTWFQKTRELAKAGFADSLGLAADSYGWEGRCEWKLDHPAKAAPLFLTQLALGDASAVVSLKALIPDRTPVDGMLNYGPEFEERQKWSDQRLLDAEQQARLGLQAAVADPLLRRLVTAHILASVGNPLWYNKVEQSAKRCAHWLAMIQEAKVGKLEDAEYLGWIAYSLANYKEAAHWLELAQNESPASNWLRAKLQRRAGQLNAAAKSMERAWQALIQPGAYTGWKPLGVANEDDESAYSSYYESFPLPAAASGDCGLMRLARGEFVLAMDTFLKGGLWPDTAYVAERVLTTDELKAYVDRQPKAAGTGDTRLTYLLGRRLVLEERYARTARLTYLLGRRLVREERYTQAARYLKPPYDKLLDKYVQALKDGADAKLPKRKRADAWLTAAWLARYDGMELMGTEVAPDGFVSNGNFADPDIAKQRQSRQYEVRTEQNGQEFVATRPMVLQPSKEELQRVSKHKISPDIRYHYRMIAAALAVKGSRLLDDNTEELADVLNTAGLWVKDRDEKLADRYYDMLEKRCPNTQLGEAVMARHWFVQEEGPWRQQQQAAHEALHADLGIQDAQE